MPRKKDKAFEAWVRDNATLHGSALYTSLARKLFEAGQAAGVVQERSEIRKSLEEYRDQVCVPDTMTGNWISNVIAMVACRGFKP